MGQELSGPMRLGVALPGWVVRGGAVALALALLAVPSCLSRDVVLVGAVLEILRLGRDIVTFPNRAPPSRRRLLLGPVVQLFHAAWLWLVATLVPMLPAASGTDLTGELLRGAALVLQAVVLLSAALGVVGLVAAAGAALVAWRLRAAMTKGPHRRP
jgi:hypothetical protein